MWFHRIEIDADRKETKQSKSVNLPIWDLASKRHSAQLHQKFATFSSLWRGSRCFIWFLPPFNSVERTPQRKAHDARPKMHSYVSWSKIAFCTPTLFSRPTWTLHCTTKFLCCRWVLRAIEAKVWKSFVWVRKTTIFGFFIRTDDCHFSGWRRFDALVPFVAQRWIAV